MATPGGHGSEQGDGGLGAFDIALRGYDRRQVDEHLAQLRAELATAARAVEQTEFRNSDLTEQLSIAVDRLRRTGSGPRDDSFGFRVEKILRLAEEEAKELRAHGAADATAATQRAHADAVAVLDAAHADAARERDDARASADAILEAARGAAARLRADAERTLSDASLEAERVRAEAARDVALLRDRANADVTAERDAVARDVAALVDEHHRLLAALVAMRETVRSVLPRRPAADASSADASSADASSADASSADASSADASSTRDVVVPRQETADHTPGPAAFRPGHAAQAHGRPGGPPR